MIADLDGHGEVVFAEVTDDVEAGNVRELDVFEHDADFKGGHGEVSAALLIKD